MTDETARCGRSMACVSVSWIRGGRRGGEERREETGRKGLSVARSIGSMRCETFTLRHGWTGGSSSRGTPNQYHCLLFVESHSRRPSSLHVVLDNGEYSSDARAGYNSFTPTAPSSRRSGLHLYTNIDEEKWLLNSEDFLLYSIQLANLALLPAIAEKCTHCFPRT